MTIIIPLSSWAQEYTLSGKVVGADNTLISYASVVLHDKDNAVVKWSTTNQSGGYEIENVKPASYTLKVSIYGYATKSITINVDRDISEYVVTLEQETIVLEEVVIRKPRVENRIDGIVFNVQNTTLSNGNTWNVLTQTPYLFRTGNQILVRGTEVPLVFINNRRVYLSSSELKQLLENTPAHLLKSVEVILNPSAKYDAEGKTIINIVMSKNLSIGYNGRVGMGYEQGVFPKYSINTGHFYKNNNLNVYAGYAYRWRKTYALYRSDTDFITNNLPSGNWHSEALEDATRSIHDFNTNIDYDINDKHSLSFSGNFSFIPNKKEFTSSFTEAIDSSFYSENRNTYIRDRVILSLDHTYDLGKGKTLTTNLHHTYHHFDEEQDIITDYRDSSQVLTRNNAFININAQDVNIYTAQTDFTSFGDHGVFETGAKVSFIEFDNRLDQINIEGSNPEFSDRFIYDETTLAAYVSYEKSWKHWNMRLGLRGENTHLKGISTIEDQTNTQDYFKLFPSILIGYNLSNNHRFNIAYNKKISRPAFEVLNPFRLFQNDNVYLIGNPNLLPTLDHRIELNYSLKHTLNVGLYLHQSTDPIYQIRYVDNEENEIILRDDNLDKNIRYGVTLQWNGSLTPWWDVSTYSDLYHSSFDFFDLQRSGQVFNVRRWTSYQRISNYFTLSKDKTFTGSATYRFNSKKAKGNFIDGVRQTFSLGLQKTLWNKKAILSFNAYDIFNQLAANEIVNYADQSIVEYSNFEYRTFEINFTYKFGNYKLRTNKKGINNEEGRRL